MKSLKQQPSSLRFQQQVYAQKTVAKKIALARQLAAFLMKKYTSCSLKTIGDYLGGRSHSTILYSINQAESYLEDDYVLSQKLTNIENTFSPNL